MCIRDRYMIDRLAGLGPDQSLMFLNYMDAYKDLSFRSGLWDAAKLFRVDGCSDDSFSYFRSWLIAVSYTHLIWAIRSNALAGTTPQQKWTACGSRTVAHGSATVSYTHLDVYKRQIVRCGFGVRRLRRLMNLGATCGNSARESTSSSLLALSLIHI